MNDSEVRNGLGNEDSTTKPEVNSPPTSPEDPGGKSGNTPSQSSHFPPPPLESPPAAHRGYESPLAEPKQESSLQKDSCPPPPSTTTAAPNIQSDLILIPPITTNKLGPTRIRKKSEEGKRDGSGKSSNKGTSPGKNRKQSSIPVGIAVAWQRHVTSSTSSTHTTTSSYASAKHHHHHSHSRPTMSSPPPKTTPKRSRATPPVPPGRVIEHKLLDSEEQNHNNANATTTMKNGCRGDDAECRSDDGQDRISATISNNSNSSFFPSAYACNNPYGDWTSQYLVPNSSQQSYNAMVAAYMQQQLSTIHPQLQYGYNNHPAAYLYGSGGYTAEQLQQYEQLLLRQQQEQQYEQRRLEYNNGLRPHPTSASLPALSPRISIPSPSPNSPYPAHQSSTSSSSPWSSDLYHHHHPMTLSSSATLSPRSLASSTPSPITTYESLTQSFLYGGRKCITPNPSPLKQWPVLGSPFSPTILPAGKDLWKEREREPGPVSLVTHGRKPGPVSPVAEERAEDEEMGIPGKEESILVKPEKKSVDFSRMESLIEKRGEASVRLLTHAPSPPPPSSAKKKKVGTKGKDVSRKGKSLDKKPGQSKSKKSSEGGRRRRADHRDCDGNEMKVPELTTIIRSSDHVNKNHKSANRSSSNGSKILAELEEREDAKYFCPIGTVSGRNREEENTIYPLDVEIRRKRGSEDEGHGPPGHDTTPSVTTSFLDGVENCDSESDGASWPRPPVGAGNKDDEVEESCKSVLYPHTFPKIVISSSESSLNLLATVAQEIGPYISMLPTPVSSNSSSSSPPRRFENLESLIRIEESKKDPSIISTGIQGEFLAGHTNGNYMETSINEEETGGGNTFQASSTFDNPPIQPFQLKIPQITPRIVDGKRKSGGLGKSGRKSAKSGIETNEKKLDLKRKKSGLKIDEAKPVKTKGRRDTSIHKEGRKGSTPTKKVRKQTDIVDHDKSKKGIIGLVGSIIRPEVSPSKVNLPMSTTQPDPKALESIYDFEIDDLRPSEGLESFKHFSSGEKVLKSESKFSILSSSSVKTMKSWSSSTLGPEDLKKKSCKTKSPAAGKKSVVLKVRGSSDPGTGNKKRMTSEKPRKKISDSGSGCKRDQNGFGTSSAAPTSSNPILRPSPMDSVVSATLNTDSNTSFVSNDSSSSAWTANPIHAVRAVIKTQESLVNGNGTKTKKFTTKKKVKTTEEDSGLSDELRKLKVTSPPSSLSTKKVKAMSPLRKKRDGSPTHHHHIKPCLKAEPIRIRSPPEESEEEELLLDLDEPEEKGGFLTQNVISDDGIDNEESKSSAEPLLRIRKPSIDMNIFSRRVKSIEEEKEEKKEQVKGVETWDENVVIGGVGELIDEMRVLTEIHGLFYTGKLNALHPPDVYGVTLDNERGAPPHIIFSAEEVLERCIREGKPWEPSQLPHGLRICAYWSPMYSGLYPGRVSTDYDLRSDLVPVEFDDGDTGVIKICEIRLLAPNHPVREYDPNPLLTLEKKHRKRRHSSAAGSQNGCTGDHEEDDCGEPYCAKIAKLQEAEAENEEEDFSPSSTPFKYWTWSGLGIKLPNTKQNRHKEFYQGIQRGDEVIKVGDSAIFISDTQNRRPFLGRVEKFWEKKGLKSVTVRWFYHPEEVKIGKKSTCLKLLKYPGALFESPHIDDNDVQTIAKKCEVLPFTEFKEKYGPHFASSGGGTKSGKSHKPAPLKGVYYVAGFYDPCTHELTMKDLK